jgi:hypothetical protein
VLDADVFILEAVGLGVRDFEHADDFRCRVDLDDIVGEGGLFAQHLADAAAQLAEVDVKALKDLLGKTAIEVDQGSEDVRDAPLGIALLADEFLRGGQDLLCLLGETVLSHHVFPSGKRYED